MKSLFCCESKVLLILAAVLTAPGSHAAELYQWVDASGNVMYGDSPPTMTYSRTVGGVGSEGPLREVPEYLQTEVATPAVSPPTATDPALDKALSRLESMMNKMREIADQVERLEQQAPARAAPKTLPTDPDPGATMVAGRLPAPNDDTGVAEPRQQQRQQAGVNMPTSPVAGPSAPAGISPALPMATGGELASVEVAPRSGSADLVVAGVAEPMKLQSEDIIGRQPLLEVAVSEPQPIVTHMTAKERVRSRWQSESLAQQRFLKRLQQRAAD